jgi:hypothetical protein
MRNTCVAEEVFFHLNGFLFEGFLIFPFKNNFDFEVFISFPRVFTLICQGLALNRGEIL